ncbi:MAG: ribosome biogenesis GTPase Der [Chloroflexi bacterium]|nr:ribosome biogenesis GTPase Der [Chloroflexota bacterium]
MKALVAIVGRPNVGKSTLFNRLAGRRQAIVDDVAGTTRDRLYADAEWTGHTFAIIDTGGLDLGSSDDMSARIREQAQAAIAEADVVVFLTDAVDGLTGLDYSVADLIRRGDAQQPVILAVNKCENEARRLAALEFYELGLGDPIPISALHGTGTGDLLDAIVAHLPADEPADDEDMIHVAIVGRPNVGKSSLLNALLGRERAIVSPVPGTTRDAIDTPIVWAGQPVVLIDTAGIRRRGRIESGVEKYSVLRALKAINRADVAVLVLDATEGVTAQDAHIAGYIIEASKGVVIAVNKWDLVPDKTGHTIDEYTAFIMDQLKFVDYVPIVFISALTRQRVDKVMDLALGISENRALRIPTEPLNRFLRRITYQHAPPTKKGQRLRFYYVTQPAVDPPTFVFFVNQPELVHFSYQRYLENQLREEFGFQGTPIKLSFRAH